MLRTKPNVLNKDRCLIRVGRARAGPSGTQGNVILCYQSRTVCLLTSRLRLLELSARAVTDVKYFYLLLLFQHPEDDSIHMRLVTVE